MTTESLLIRRINTEKDYEDALERLEVIFDARKGTAEGNELEALGMLIEKYENEVFPIEDIVNLNSSNTLNNNEGLSP